MLAQPHGNVTWEAEASRASPDHLVAVARQHAEMVARAIGRAIRKHYLEMAGRAFRRVRSILGMQLAIRHNPHRPGHDRVSQRTNYALANDLDFVKRRFLS